jgi:hypothetical protein
MSDIALLAESASCRPFGGERDAARVPLEQRHAQARLELAHVVADRAWR